MTWDVPGHTSLFVITNRLLGWYDPKLPTVFTLAGILLGYAKFFSGGSAYTSLAIVHFATLAFGPDSSYDRTLAAFLPAMFILLHHKTFTATMIVMLSIVGFRVPFETQDLAGLLALWTPPLSYFAALVIEGARLANGSILWLGRLGLESETEFKRHLQQNGGPITCKR
jgi:hypothetical protein